MSELIQKNDNRATIRWKLLTSASAAALIASACGIGDALAADDGSGKPQVWIELGAQIERANGGDSAFAAPFYGDLPPEIDSPATIINQLPWSLGPEAKISLQPDGSNWIFSAAIRYGRSSNHRSAHQVTYQPPGYNVSGYPCCHTFVKHVYGDYANTQSHHQENHLILDFQAGKDVGVGLFGKDGSSVVSAGVRFAQFRTKSSGSVKARADFERYDYFTYFPSYAYWKSLYLQKYRLITANRRFALTAGSSRSFKGVGPSISWQASAALAGNPESSELTFDWGVNAAFLFGKQRTKTYHESHISHHLFVYQTQTFSHPGVPQTRSRSVTVPNLGGMAGFSIKWPDAKISIGYRADYFFGAMDGGWDTAKKQNRSFTGPFASISFGLGD